MNHSEGGVPGVGDTFGTEAASIMPRKPGFFSAFLGRTGGALAEDIRADAELASFRMQLTEFALTRIGAFSAMEQQMSYITPQAAERCQALVDACTRQTIKQIERW